MSSKSDKTQAKALAPNLSDASSIIIRADNAKLAELGYRSEFRREFSVRQMHRASSVTDRLVFSFTSASRRLLSPFP